jgi:hypothetical protein
MQSPSDWLQLAGQLLWADFLPHCLGLFVHLSTSFYIFQNFLFCSLIRFSFGCMREPSSIPYSLDLSRTNIIVNWKRYRIAIKNWKEFCIKKSQLKGTWQ